MSGYLAVLKLSPCLRWKLALTVKKYYTYNNFWVPSLGLYFHYISEGTIVLFTIYRITVATW